MKVKILKTHHFLMLLHFAIIYGLVAIYTYYIISA